MMLTLGIFAILLAVIAADITGTNPSTGSCLCIDGNTVNIRNPACGTLVGQAGRPSCFTYRGSKTTCALGGTSYEWFNINYGSGAWVAGTYLNLGSASQCQSGGGPGNCADARIVSRSGWSARSPTSITGISTPVGYLFIHHTAGSSCTTQTSCSQQMRNLQNYDMDIRGYSDIGYSWLVGEDGQIYEGRGWDRAGGHTRGYNNIAVAICFMGTFTSRNPNAAAQKAAQDLMACGLQQGKLSSSFEMFGHRDGGCTECPGNTLYPTIRTWPYFSTRTIPKYCKRYQYGNDV